MFKATVYNVMIDSLSGSMEEVYVAKEVVRKWNQQNAERSGKLFLPVEWTTNSEELQNVDVVIGVIGNYIDNKRLIEDCIETGKKVLLFFSAYQDSHNTIQSEHDAVKAFRERVKARCFCADFVGALELNKMLNERLLLLY